MGTRLDVEEQETIAIVAVGIQSPNHLALQPHGLQHARPPCPSPSP